ncbi:MAG TPA: DUF308 domain-containing protein [candidate division Zixibacteria bacterium]|nr:DUF308 domain-containing protein [candidate division Zixibacteria bacterium]
MILLLVFISEIIGIILGLLAFFYPKAGMIFIYLTLGNFFIFAGLALYVIQVVRDLKKHKVL